MKIVIILPLLISVVLCAQGVDISHSVAESQLVCLIKQDFTFIIVNCYNSSGVNPACASDVALSHSAGMDTVDIYMFPCFKCGNPYDQMSDIYNYTSLKGVKYSNLWIEVEDPEYWGTVSENVGFFQQLIDAGEHLGILMGIHTSSSQWTLILGNSTAGSIYPLWYTHTDNQKSFSDFVPFGGWKAPFMKQYNGNRTSCGVGANFDWMPGGNSTSGPSTIATGPATHSTSSTTHATSTTTHATSAAVTHSTSTTTHSTSAVVTHATSTTTHSTSADVTHATSTVTHATSTTTHSTSTDATHSTGTTTHATSADVTHSTVAATHSTGPDSTGPASSTHTVGPDSTGPATSTHSSGPATSTHSSGPATSTHSSGPDSTGPASSTSKTTSGTSQSSYSGGGDTSGSSADFRFLGSAIYNAKLGGHRIPIVQEERTKQQKEKGASDKESKNQQKEEEGRDKESRNQQKEKEVKKIVVKFEEVEDALEKDAHFKVVDEKIFNKF